MYLDFLLFPNIEISKRNPEIELVHEVLKDNRKVELTYTFGDFLVAIKKKAQKYLDQEELYTEKTGIIVAKILFVFARYLICRMY